MGCCESLPCDYSKQKSIKELIEKKELKTGDLIFFSSIGGLFSCLIKTVTFNPSSHVGMVYIKNGQYYLWHSPNRPVNNCKDSITNTEKSGPQLNLLECALKEYNGSFMLRKLERFTNSDLILIKNMEAGEETKKLLELDELTENPLENKIFLWMKEQTQKAYEKSWLQLILAASPLKCNYEDNSTYFCSELVADTYKIYGLFPEDTIPSNYTPADLASSNSTGGIFRLLGGFYLSSSFICISKE